MTHTPNAMAEIYAPRCVERRDDLERRLRLCSFDELRVLGVILSRLELGRERYGYLDLSRDRRDWKRERAEEYVDLAIYDACDVLSFDDERARHSVCEAHDEMHARVSRGLTELGDAEIVTAPRPLVEFDMPDDLIGDGDEP